MPLCEKWYEEHCREYQATLDACPGGIVPKLRIAHEEHLANGFIEDDLSERFRYRICPREGGVALILQENSRRQLRLETPKPRRLPEHLRGLPRLDLRVIPYSSSFRQYPYRYRVNGRPYAMLTSPFPYGRLATTICSTIEKDTQSWEGSPDRFSRIVADLCELARQAEGACLVYNGPRAGATIPETLHFSLIERELDPWPLELAAEQAQAHPGEFVTLVDNPPLFPLTAFRFRGDAEEIVRAVCAVARLWHVLLPGQATENLIASAGSGMVSVFYVPRDGHHERAAAPGGLRIGSLEALGEVVAERSPVDPQLYDFDKLCLLLRSVRPHAADALTRRFVM
jgi:hypothetical protein